jgi:hypothetical protein
MRKIYSGWLSSKKGRAQERLARLRSVPDAHHVIGALGAGAVGGAFVFPVAAKLGANRVMTGATVGTALAIALFAVAREPATGLIAVGEESEAATP